VSLWRGKDPLILASQSRARQTLLANAGIDFEAIPADIDERAAMGAAEATSAGDVASSAPRATSGLVASSDTS